EHDDNDGAGVLDTAALEDLRLDVIDADSRERRPDDREQQQHDDGALATHNQHDHNQKSNEQRDARDYVHGASPLLALNRPIAEISSLLCRARPISLYSANACAHLTSSASSGRVQAFSRSRLHPATRLQYTEVPSLADRKDANRRSKMQTATAARVQAPKCLSESDLARYAREGF